MSNLIECDGCLDKIQADQTTKCSGCGHNFCPDCAQDMGLSPTEPVCKYCREYVGEVMADCEQRRR